MTTMSVRSFVQTAQRLPGSTSVLLRGNHGIGKSQIARQVADLIRQNENLQEFPVIDRRLSQVTEGDIIGLPSTDGNVTRFNPPDWYRKACDEPCFLFLDELNRATPEVMQAAFQIVLDRELNGWKLHPQTRVMSAVNASAAYNVNEMDPALLDRFWVVDLHPDTQDWLVWAKKDNRIHYSIIEFITSNDKWLDPGKVTEPGRVQPSRRSWERLSHALVSAEIVDNPTNEMFYMMCLGYVGLEASIAYSDFAKTIDNRFTGEEIVNKYKKVRKKVTARNSADVYNSAIEKVTDYLLKARNAEPVTDAQGKNLSSFMDDLPAEQKMAFWKGLIEQGIDTKEFVKSVHIHLVDQILAIFNVKKGEAGIGMVPNIPDFAKK
jgi:hypothetical protein